jgi:hypothetical protein
VCLVIRPYSSIRLAAPDCGVSRRTYPVLEVVNHAASRVTSQRRQTLVRCWRAVRGAQKNRLRATESGQVIQFMTTLRRLADAGVRCDSVAGKRFVGPTSAPCSIEHEVEGERAELEFQQVWSGCDAPGDDQP